MEFSRNYDSSRTRLNSRLGLAGCKEDYQVVRKHCNFFQTVMHLCHADIGEAHALGVLGSGSPVVPHAAEILG